jgi:subtilisin family serine protease
MSDYSSFGLDYDPHKFKYVIKDVFMTPGQNIRSTLPDGKYGTMSGTSMATPALNGVVAALLSYNPAPDPITAASRLVAALRSSSAPMDVSTLPPDISLAQNFLVIDPAAALKALKAQQNAGVGKYPQKKDAARLFRAGPLSIRDRSYFLWPFSAATLAPVITSSMIPYAFASSADM